MKKICPHCQQIIQEWVTYRHISRKLNVRARIDGDNVVTYQGTRIESYLFFQFYEPVSGG